MDMILNQEFSGKKWTVNQIMKFDMEFLNQITEKSVFQLCLPDCIQEIYIYDVTNSP